jgi:hypothetical protein
MPAINQTVMHPKRPNPPPAITGWEGPPAPIREINPRNSKLPAHAFEMNADPRRIPRNLPLSNQTRHAQRGKIVNEITRRGSRRRHAQKHNQGTHTLTRSRIQLVASRECKLHSRIPTRKDTRDGSHRAECRGGVNAILPIGTAPVPSPIRLHMWSLAVRARVSRRSVARAATSSSKHDRQPLQPRGDPARAAVRPVRTYAAHTDGIERVICGQNYLLKYLKIRYYYAQAPS